jgi:hypothetical protein
MKHLPYLLALFGLLPTSGFGQKAITIHRQQITAAEVLGVGKEFGPQLRPEEAGRTVLLAKRPTQPIQATSLNQYLGGIYSTTNLSAEPKNFLTLEEGYPQPILDTINYTYYRVPGFYKLDQDEKYRNMPGYEAFKNAFQAARNTAQQRAVLLDPAHRQLRPVLEATRFSTYSTASGTTFSANTKISNALKAGVSADITAALQATNIRFNGNLKSSIDNAVTRSVTLSGGRYHEIKLDPGYVRQVAQVLRGYVANPDRIPATNAFNEELRQFLPSTSEAIVVGAAVLEGNFAISFSQDLKSAVTLAVRGSLQNPAAVSLADLSAAVDASISHSLKRDYAANTGQTFFYIRLVYSRALELQSDLASTGTRP